MTKSYFCLMLLIALNIHVFAQRKIDPTPEDITLANSLKEQFPDDQVALITHNDEVTFGINKKSQKVTVNHLTSKTIMNIDARADIQEYCAYDGETTIESFTIKYRNKKSAGFYLKDEAYTSNDLFHNDTRVKYTNIDFPVKGYKYHIALEKNFKDIKYFTKLYFNTSYPSVKKTITLKVPSWLEIELKEFNFGNHDIKKEITEDPKGKFTTYSFTLENVAAMHKEDNAPGPTYTYPHILILAKSFKINDKKTQIFETTQDLYNWYKSLVNSLENDTTPIKAQVAALIKDVKTDKEKIKNIYYWVQDNIRYIAFEDGIAGFKPEEASEVFNKKYGDCKGMANLTKLMLKEAGFDARLAWIGTKRIAYDYSTPNLAVDNHMICALLKDDKTIFLDATEKFNAYGEYANRIQGKQVLIEDGDNFMLKEIPQSNADFNKESIDYNFTLANNTISGSAIKTFNGESRASLLYYFNSLQNDKKDDFLEWYLNKGDINIDVNNINVSDLGDREINVDISYDLSIKNAVSDFDGSIYIDLDFDKQFSKYLFKKRKTDFIFSTKKDLESTTRLEIPSGYTISGIPEDIAVSSKNYDMTVKFKKDNNALIYKKVFKIKNATIETSDFEEWNAFIEQLNSVYNEQIILTKQ